MNEHKNNNIEQEEQLHQAKGAVTFNKRSSGVE
jgi:hypothetical protein